MKISHIAEKLIGSEIIKIAGQVNAQKAAGAEITNLTIGDLNSEIYPIPELLKEEIKKAYDHNLTNYPPAPGLLSLRTAIADDLLSRWNQEYAVDEILVSAGSRPLIYGVYKAIVDPGEKVIYPVPSWNNNHYAYLSSADPIEIPTTAEHNFLPTAEELQPHVENAVLLALCSPLNPTGTLFTREQLSEICELVIAENKRRGPDEKPLYILYDQIYALLTFGPEHFNPVILYPELRDYTIMIDGTSKCFAATGVRVGWSFGPKHVISKMTELLGHVGAWAPKPEQHAVAVLLNHPDEVNLYLGHYKSRLNNSLRYLHQAVQQLKNEGLKVDSIEPMGALYLTIKLDYIGQTTAEGDTIKNSTALVSYLIDKAGVALVPFSAFGTGPEAPWFRASVGAVSLEELQAMVPRLRNALTQLS